MAGKFFTLAVSVAHDSSALTVAQFLVATNARALLHNIAVQPRGSTAATAPLRWTLGTQDGAGTSSSASADLIKVAPTYSASIGTTALKTFTAEASTHTDKYNISVHMQGTLLWLPPKGPIVMESAERWGLKYAASQSSLTVDYQFLLEE